MPAWLLPIVGIATALGVFMGWYFSGTGVSPRELNWVLVASIAVVLTVTLIAWKLLTRRSSS
jgi:hypothetical protein